MAGFESVLLTIGATVFVLGILIFFHELGHFIMAKRAGIRVEKFSLGFPPTIFKKKYGETEYCIGIVPLGGFVKMAGENPDETAKGAPDEFMSKSVGARAAVIFAGPFTNLVLAWIILWGIFTFKGEPYQDNYNAVLGRIADGYPAELAGLQPGDIVKAVNGETLSPLGHVKEYVKETFGRKIDIKWQDGDKILKDSVAVGVDYAAAAGINPGSRILAVDNVPIGPEENVRAWLDLKDEVEVTYRHDGVEKSVVTISGDKPLKKAGIKKDDEILTIAGEAIDSPQHFNRLIASIVERPVVVELTSNGESHPLAITKSDKIDDKLKPGPSDTLAFVDGIPVSTFSQMAILISRQQGKEITVDIERDGNILHKTMTTRIDQYIRKGDTISYGVIGVGRQKSYHDVSFGEAPVLAFKWSGRLVREVIVFLGRILSMRESAKNIGGPVLIAQWAGRMAQEGFTDLLVFMALLSVNLGVLNVLPIPVLDGGHLVFLLIEKIKGSSLTINQRLVAQQIGFFVLLAVIIAVTYNDIARLITG